MTYPTPEIPTYYQVSWEDDSGGDLSKFYVSYTWAEKVALKRVKEGWACVQVYATFDYETLREWIHGEETDRQDLEIGA